MRPLSTMLPAPHLRSSALLLTALLAVLLAGCGSEAPAPPGDRSTVTDDLGRSVAVSVPARRVLPLAPSLTEVVAAAGGLGHLIAVSPFDDHPPAVRGLPTFGTLPLDFEAVVAHRADLALGTAQVNNPADGERLATLGVPTLYYRFERLADVPRAMRQVGALLGTEAAADSAAAAFEARLAAFERALPKGDAPRTLVLIGDEVLYAFGRASYVHEMVWLAGGTSITAGFSGEGVTLSEEFVLVERPERIVVLAGAGYDTARLVQRHPAFRAVPAVREGHVCGVDADLVSRPGPRLVDGVAALHACLGGGTSRFQRMILNPTPGFRLELL